MRVAMMLGAVAALLYVGAGTPASASAPKSRVQALLRLEAKADETCRGSYPDDPAQQPACDARALYDRQLGRLGWCYGKRGQSGYQEHWHQCTAASNPPIQ